MKCELKKRVYVDVGGDECKEDDSKHGCKDVRTVQLCIKLVLAGKNTNKLTFTDVYGYETSK